MAGDIQHRFQDFHVQRHLGEGCYSQVYCAVKKSGKDKGREYALKITSITTDSATRCVLRERNVLGKLDSTCPFITSLFYSFVEGNNTFMAITLAKGGDLFDVLNKLGKLTESDARFYISELICSIEYLHAKRIVHLDIKPENILLDPSGHIYLCDFDRAFDLDMEQTLSDFQGTALYMAPEVAREIAITPKADIWSIGMVAAEMVVGPLRSSGTEEENKRVAKDGRYNQRSLKSVSKPFMAFLNTTFRKTPEERPTASDLKRSRFLKMVKWDIVLSKTLQAPYNPQQELPFSVSEATMPLILNLDASHSRVLLPDFNFVHVDLIEEGFRKITPG